MTIKEMTNREMCLNFCDAANQFEEYVWPAVRAICRAQTISQERKASLYETHMRFCRWRKSAFEMLQRSAAVSDVTLIEFLRVAEKIEGASDGIYTQLCEVTEHYIFAGLGHEFDDYLEKYGIAIVPGVELGEVYEKFVYVFGNREDLSRKRALILERQYETSPTSEEVAALQSKLKAAETEVNNFRRNRMKQKSRTT